MADVLQFTPQELKTYIVVRTAKTALPYLAQYGETYRWVNNVQHAVRLNTEQAANELAARVAGGASVAELIAV